MTKKEKAENFINEFEQLMEKYKVEFKIYDYEISVIDTENNIELISCLDYDTEMGANGFYCINEKESEFIVGGKND